MNIAFLIGRIIFGGYWLMASFNRFKNLNYMSEYAKARGRHLPNWRWRQDIPPVQPDFLLSPTAST
jgi:hypothetical protein